MSTQQDFETHFDQEIYDSQELVELEKFRKIASTNYIISGILTAVIVIIVFAKFEQGGLLALLFLVIPIILYIKGSNRKNQFRKNFKSAIIRPTLKFVDPGLRYFPDKSIPFNEYRGSGLFTKDPDRYEGEDLIQGKLGKTAVKFSELHSKYKTTTRDSKGNTRTTWVTIFKGLFFVADFNKHFKSEIFVLPDVSERLFGRIGKIFQKSLFRGERVDLESPEFEKEFVTYSDDQIEARYILSASLMERIMVFKKKTGMQIYLSFTNSKINIALPMSKNLFEHNIFSRNYKKTALKSYYYFELITGITDDLNLNTRIWTKE